MALSAENRLRRPAEFKNVLTGSRYAGRSSGTRRTETEGVAGGRAGDHLLLVSAISTERSGSRIGFSVSKKVGGSVTRNRVRRRLREIFRELVVAPMGSEWYGEASWDFVVTARPGSAEATFEDLRGSAKRLILKVKAGR